VVKIGNNIYVLHAFQKKSKQGIKTPQSDVDLIKQRYKDAVIREQEQ
jgi:phage-related protein